MIKCLCIVISNELRKEERRRGMERTVARALLPSVCGGFFFNCMWEGNEFTHMSLS